MSQLRGFGLVRWLFGGWKGGGKEVFTIPLSFPGI